MKKLLCLGFTALMMLFAFGNANAENAKIKVVLDPATWTIGTTAPQFTVTITPATTTGEGDGGTAAAAEGDDALTLGTAEGNVAVKVSLTNSGNTKEQVITTTSVALTTTDLAAGEWTLSYTLVKGNATTDNFVGDAEMDNDASTPTLTVAAATEPEPTPAEKVANPTFTPGTGEVTANSTVTIATTTQDATIRYKKGDAEWADYTAAITIDAAVTLKACAIKEGMTSSDTMTATYTIAAAPTPVQKPNNPTFSPVAGAVDANAKVTIRTTTTGATIRYKNGDAEWADYSTPVVIEKAVTLMACAVKDEVSSDTVTASYTIAVLPADEEGAPALTFTPDNTAEVDNNTEIVVTGIDTEKYIEVDYGVFSSVTKALSAGMTAFDPYGGFMGGYPTVTEETPILVFRLFDGEKTIKYYRHYKVKAASEVDMPQIVVPESETYNMFQVCSKGDKVQLQAEADAIYYTTDGTKPTPENGTRLEKAEDGVAGGFYTLEAAVVIKAIAVKEGKASDVAVARYNLVEDMHATLSIKADSLVGKNNPVGFSIAVEELGEGGANIDYMRPLTVYYTLDGQTEPTQEAYEKWLKEDSANNPIKKVSAEVDEEGYPGMDANGNTVSMTLTEAGLVSFKGKGYLLLGDTKGLITTATISKTLNVIAAEEPEFSIVSGKEVRVGDSLIISTIYPDTVGSALYFSFDGTNPSKEAYYALMDEMDSDADLEQNIFRLDDGKELKIYFRKDEEGKVYADMPEVYNVGTYTEGVRVDFDENVFSIEVIQYISLPTGKTNMMGRPEMMEVPSDVVEATYLLMKDFPKPVITPNGGIVVKGEEVEITAEEGLDIYYTTDGTEPTKAATKYAAAIKVNEAMTLKAIAFKVGAEGERDSLSNVAVAVFTLVPEIAVKPVNNTVVNDSIIFANGNVAFDMFIKDFTEADRIYKLQVTVWNTANEDDMPFADEFEAADSVRFMSTYYNGEYEATFELMQPSPRGGYISAKDTTITFYVTENEEIVDNYELIVTAVDATMKEDTAMFTSGNIAFDIKVNGMREKDTLTLVTSLFTKVAFDTMGDFFKADTVDAADSVRFEATEIAAGEYVAVVELMRKVRGENAVVEAATLAFIVEKKDNNDTTANIGKELAGVSIYPNPSEGEFNVVAPANAQVEIFNAAGMLVKRANVNAGVNAMRLNNSGIYFVRVSANGQVAIKKVVIR